MEKYTSVGLALCHRCVQIFRHSWCIRFRLVAEIAFYLHLMTSGIKSNQLCIIRFNKLVYFTNTLKTILKYTYLFFTREKYILKNLSCGLEFLSVIKTYVFRYWIKRASVAATLAKFSNKSRFSSEYINY